MRWKGGEGVLWWKLAVSRHSLTDEIASWYHENLMFKVIAKVRTSNNHVQSRSQAGDVVVSFWVPNDIFLWEVPPDFACASKSFLNERWRKELARVVEPWSPPITFFRDAEIAITFRDVTLHKGRNLGKPQSMRLSRGWRDDSESDTKLADHTSRVSSLDRRLPSIFQLRSSVRRGRKRWNKKRSSDRSQIIVSLRLCLSVSLHWKAHSTT